MRMPSCAGGGMCLRENTPQQTLGRAWMTPFHPSTAKGVLEGPAITSMATMGEFPHDSHGRDGGPLQHTRGCTGLGGPSKHTTGRAGVCRPRM